MMLQWNKSDQWHAGVDKERGVSMVTSLHLFVHSINSESCSIISDRSRLATFDLLGFGFYVLVSSVWNFLQSTNQMLERAEEGKEKRAEEDLIGLIRVQNSFCWVFVLLQIYSAGWHVVTTRGQQCYRIRIIAEQKRCLTLCRWPDRWQRPWLWR